MGTGDFLTDSALFRRERDLLRERVLQLQLLTEQLPIILWTTDFELKITSALGAGLTSIGERPANLIGLGVQDYLQHPEPSDQEFPAVQVHLDALKGVSGTFDIVWKGKTFQAYVMPLRDSREEIAGTVGLALDITERKQTEQALRESESNALQLLSELRRSQEELDDFFEYANLPIRWMDPDGIILRANRSELELFGYPEEVHVGLSAVGLFNEPRDFMQLLSRLRKGEAVQGYEAQMRCKDGSLLHVLIDANGRWESGRLQHIRCFTRDVTELKRAEARLRELALSDPLTGLPNRTVFMDLAHRALERLRLDPTATFAALFLDLDGLKTINDTAGHLTGDEFLLETGRILRRCIRPGDLASRYGGDEFVVLLFGMSHAADVAQVADRIGNELTAWASARRLGAASASIGALLVQSGRMETEELIRQADAAMYEAKGAGKGTFRLRSVS